MAMHDDTESLLGIGRDRYVPVYRPRPMVLDHGRGSRLWDMAGKEYVDLAGGIAVCALGHADPELIQALTTQAGKLWHTSNAFNSEPPLRLAEELVTASRFAERVFLCNSGTEANEAAIKLVRKHAALQGRAPDKRVIVTARGSFHGRTLAAVTATAQPKYQEGYEPLPGGFRYVDFNDLAQLEAAMVHGDVCAVMLEPVQGEGGVMPAAPGYLQGVRTLCNQHDALLVLDEIQCGMGRTGPLFAHWADQVVPDVVTLAKALGAASRSARCWSARRRRRRCNSAPMAPPSAATRWRRRSRAWRCGASNRPKSPATSRGNRRRSAMGSPRSTPSSTCSRKCAAAA